MSRSTLLPAVLAALAVPFAGYPQVCTLRNDEIGDQISARAEAVLMAAVANDIVDNAPVTTPEAKQVTAVSASGAESSLADGADFNRLLGLAVENGLATSSADGVTFDLNLFALRAALDRSVIEEQSKYEQYAFLRRFSGALTFGGKGEPQDIDGDGTLEPAQTLESLADIVTIDLRFRLSKRSRDRRDPDNYGEIQTRVRASLQNVDFHVNDIATDLDKEGFRPAQMPDCREQLTARLAAYDVEKLKALGVALNKTAVDYADAIKDIDSSVIWTLAVSGTERDREFGQDKVRVGIRGAMGAKESDWNVNFDYGETESLTAADDQKTTKLAFEWKVKVLERLMGSTGLDASFSASVEHYENVPDVAHDRVSKLNARLVYPISDTLKIPISVTWANHADLLTDESDIRGNIGFTVDFDSLSAPK